MDLSNKQINIARLSVNNIERLSIIEVNIKENVTDTVVKQVGLYEFTLNKTFSGISDPQLMPAIREVLEGIPE